MLILRNTSTTTCDLRGYPQIALLNRDGSPLPYRYRDHGDQELTGSPPTSVELAAGAKAYFAINKSTCAGYTNTAAKQISVTAPGQTHQLTLKLQSEPFIGYCPAGDPGHTVDLSPVEQTFKAVLNLPGTTSTPAGGSASSTVPAGVSACAASEVSIKPEQQAVGMMHIQELYAITNTGDRACWMRGYPTLQPGESAGLILRQLNTNPTCPSANSGMGHETLVSITLPGALKAISDIPSRAIGACPATKNPLEVSPVLPKAAWTQGQ